MDAFLAFEPEQLQNLAKDGSGSADLSRLDDIATQAKFTKAFIEAGQSFEAAENFVDGAGFDPDVFAGFEFEDIKTAVSANADGVNTDPDAFFGAIDLDQIKSTAEVVKDLGDSGTSASELLAQLNSAVLKDANGLPLVFEDEETGLFKWAANLKGAKFYALWTEEDDAEQSSSQWDDEAFELLRFPSKAENPSPQDSPVILNGKDVLGTDAGSSWVENVEVLSPSVIKLAKR